MAFEWLKNLVGGSTAAVEVIEKIADKIPDANSRLELSLAFQKLIADMQQKILDLERQVLNNQTKLIAAEAKGNFLQRSWRPILMLSFGFIICYNYWFAPTFGTPVTELPERFWNLLEISVGGYVIGRSFEKFIPPLGEVLKKK